MGVEDDGSQELPAPVTPAPRLLGYRKILLAVGFHATTTGVLAAGWITPPIWADLTMAIVLSAIGSNVLAKFAHAFNARSKMPPPTP